MKLRKYFNISKNKLFPMSRSITGNGLRETLNIIRREFPSMKIKFYKSGSKVFDWRIPPEWNIHDAYVVDKNNNKIIDFKKNNLHVVSYSKPVNKFISTNELLNKLYISKKRPNAIPYVTSYYKRDWGFCTSLKHKNKIKKMYDPKDKFRVVIKSNFKKKGNLNIGELIIKGKCKKEIIISTYICHPSMANNELSGPTVSMGLINNFQKKISRYTLRFVFLPETIGSITYLHHNLNTLKKNTIAGFNLTCIGDEKNFQFMETKYGNSISDKALKEAYKVLKINPKMISFLENGSDERQYNSPGIDLPVASIFKTKYGNYVEYHTSDDNFDFVTFKGLKDGYKIAKKAIDIINTKIIPMTNYMCEPQMGKRNLYPHISTGAKLDSQKNIMNFLQFCDGRNDLEDIAKKIKININLTKKIHKKLLEHRLIR